MRSQNEMSELSHRTPWWGLVRALRATIFLMLAGTARETVSARTALHARTRAKMARKARSFWLSSDLHDPKSSWTLLR
jgi:hypothetical protein